MSQPMITVDAEVTADGRVVLNLHFFSPALSFMVTLGAAGVAYLSGQMATAMGAGCAEAARLALARSAANAP